MNAAPSTLPAHLQAILAGAVRFAERAPIVAPRDAAPVFSAPAAQHPKRGALPDMPELESHDFGALECNADDAFFSIGIDL